MSRTKSPQLESHAVKLAKWLSRAAVFMTALFPLVIFPGIERPFSTPKIILLACFVAGSFILTFSASVCRLPPMPASFRLALILWPFSLIVSALLGRFVAQETLWLFLLAEAWFLLLLMFQPRPGIVALAVVIPCGVNALIGIAQYLGADPFSILGWTTSHYGSPRMRVLGTLGNPNFLAAVLSAVVPLSIHLGRSLQCKVLYYLIIALEILAIFATGSRAAIAAVLAALSWVCLHGQFRRWKLLTAAALVVVILLPFMPSRPLLSTIEGRMYIWRVTLPHLVERPLFGSGPGAFEPRFVEWETVYWRDGYGSDEQRKFTGLQAHAHNDYLELLVDSGMIGGGSMLLLLGSFLSFSYRAAVSTGDDFLIAVSAGVVALAAIAIVDFPFHRPVELFLLWTFMALVFLQAAKKTPGTRTTGLE